MKRYLQTFFLDWPSKCFSPFNFGCTKLLSEKLVGFLFWILSINLKFSHFISKIIKIGIIVILIPPKLDRCTIFLSVRGKTDRNICFSSFFVYVWYYRIKRILKWICLSFSNLKYYVDLITRTPKPLKYVFALLISEIVLNKCLVIYLVLMVYIKNYV